MGFVADVFVSRAVLHGDEWQQGWGFKLGDGSDCIEMGFGGWDLGKGLVRF